MRCRGLVTLLACVASGGCTGIRAGDRDEGPWVELRLATWNVQSLGELGSDELIAAERVLGRLDADVVVLQEVGRDEQPQLEQVGDALGYPIVVAANRFPWGDLGTAALARRSGVTVAFPDAASLSGDAAADDLTRLPAVVTIPVPDVGATVSLTGVHLKSGFQPADRFRRVVDAIRTSQAAVATGADVVVLAGDLNDDVGDAGGSAAPWTAVPAGSPAGWALGRDLRERLEHDGLPHDVFRAFDEAGLAPLEARQRDGSVVTRPVSGRRLDYVLGRAGADGIAWRGETYDDADEAKPGVADGGAALDPGTVAAASDHLPITGVLRISAR